MSPAPATAPTPPPHPTPRPDTRPDTQTAPVVVLHLRQATGRGGGADSMLAHLVTGLAADPDAPGPGVPILRPQVAYLAPSAADLAPLIAPLIDAGVMARACPGRPPLDVGQLRRLLAWIDDEGVRLLHSHDPKSSVLAALLGLLRPRLVMVATLHGQVRRRARSHLYLALERLALHRAQALGAVSAALAAEMRRGWGKARLGRRIHVLPNGVDTTFWQPDPALDAATIATTTIATTTTTVPTPEPPFALVFAGRLSAEKDPLLALAVVERLQARGLPVHLHIAGEGPEEEAVRAGLVALAARNPTQPPPVTLHGALDPPALRALLRRSQALLLPSRTEGLPMAALEAGALGLPVIATRVGGLGEVIDDGTTGLLCPAGDADALAEAANRLIRDPATARRMGAAARDRVVAHFSRPAFVARWRALYAAVLADSTAAAPPDPAPPSPARVGRP